MYITDSKVTKSAQNTGRTIIQIKEANRPLNLFTMTFLQYQLQTIKVKMKKVYCNLQTSIIGLKRIA